MKYFYSLVLGFSFFWIQAQELNPRYELVRIGDKVNTLYHEVSPVISNDGKELYYVLNNHPENTFGKENSQDIWVTSLDENGEWSKPRHLGSPFNQNRYNQVLNVLPDGSLFIRGGRSKNSSGFSIVSQSGAAWTELKITDFEAMDKGLFDGATISGDRDHVIMNFSEKQGDKFSDLYLSNRQPDGRYSRPVKLKISSLADDYSPFLAADQKTLYFSSDRYAKDKVGGTDIYKTTRLDDTWLSWSEPVNLGRSVNTAAGDAYFSIDATGNIFTARSGARVDGGNFDLLILKIRDIKVLLTGNTYNQKTQQPVVSNVEIIIKELPKPVALKTSTAGRFETRIPEIQEYSIQATSSGLLPFSQTYKVPKLNNDTTLHVDIYMTPVAKQLALAGEVINKKTDQRIPNSKVDIAWKNDRSTNFKIVSKDGKYQQDIASMGWYVLTASAEGFINATDSVEVLNEEVIPVFKNLYLTPIEVGLTVRLKNIYFDFDKTTLKSESFVELDKVVEFLKTNSQITIEIAGHTDNKGSDVYNETLSQGRSQSVVNYLIEKGIDSSRLQAHGYGEAKPIETNDTEEGRANNRRVEFTVLKIN